MVLHLFQISKFLFKKCFFFSQWFPTPSSAAPSRRWDSSPTSSFTRTACSHHRLATRLALLAIYSRIYLTNASSRFKIELVSLILCFHLIVRSGYQYLVVRELGKWSLDQNTRLKVFVNFGTRLNLFFCTRSKVLIIFVTRSKFYINFGTKLKVLIMDLLLYIQLPLSWTIVCLLLKT